MRNTQLVFIVLAFILFFNTNGPLFSQCQVCESCDFVIDSTNTYIQKRELVEALGTSDFSGMKICIKAGVYNQMGIVDLEGSADNYVTVTNCDGLVEINATLVLYNGKYIRLLGDGCSSYKYGIRVNSNDNHVEIKENGSQSSVRRVTDIEIAHLEIGGDSGLQGSAGIKIIDQPGCEDVVARNDPDKWVIRNLNIHNNYIHNVGTEGMYLGKGDGFYSGTRTILCDGVKTNVWSSALRNVRIYDNKIDSTGWDGLQLKDADSAVYIYNNEISWYGLSRIDTQNEGLLLGDGTTGEIYHNKIINGTGNGFQYFGQGNLNFHDNILSNVGQYGIWTLGKFDVFPEGYINIFNNTIVKTDSSGIKFQGYEGLINRFENNILVEVNPKSALFKDDRSLDFVSNNLYSRDAVEVGFMSYQENTDEDFLSNDYHLSENSMALNAGKDVIGFKADSIGFDFDGQARKYDGSAYEIGAFEFIGTPGKKESKWSYFVNAGGTEYSFNNTLWDNDKQGNPNLYLDDSYYTLATGGTGSFSGQNTTDAPNAILGSYRYSAGNNDTIRYNIPVPQPNRNYQVTLYFAAKNNDSFNSGDRKFNILTEGRLITTYDVFDKAGNYGKSATAYEYSIEVNDGILNLVLAAATNSRAQINSFSISLLPEVQALTAETYTINCGGADFLDGNTWAADSHWSPHPYLDNSYNSYATGGTASFSGPNDTGIPKEILGSYRYTNSNVNDTIQYKIPVSGSGNYSVELFFAFKKNDDFSAGRRQFNILSESQFIKTFDVYKEAGSGAASYRYDVTVADDTLNLMLAAIPGSEAQVNAIRIYGPVPAKSQVRVAAEEEEVVELPAEVSLYPNPVANTLHIYSPNQQEAMARIIDMRGQVYFDKRMEFMNNKISINTSELPHGQIYLLTLQSVKNGKRVVHKFIKNE